MKYCRRCKKEQPFIEFHKDGNMKDGLARWCKTCASWNSKRYYNNNKDKYLLKTYGISSDQRSQMLADQNGKCLICETELPAEKAVVDHCHTNGNVRGLLCNACNSVLGFAKDNVKTLKNAIKYLHTHNTQEN